MQTLLVLDPYHQDDFLFLRLLARRLAGPGSILRPLFLIHGSGERAERLLESAGQDAVRQDGVLRVNSTAEIRLVERGIRESNQRITAAMTEEGVAAVSIQGCDRRLFRSDDTGNQIAVFGDGLVRMAEAGAVPVISMLRAGETNEATEVDPNTAIRALSAALAERGPLRILFLTTDGHPGLRVGGRITPRLSIRHEATRGSLDTAAHTAATSLVGQGYEVWIGNVSGLGDPMEGTVLLQDDP